MLRPNSTAALNGKTLTRCIGIRPCRVGRASIFAISQNDLGGNCKKEQATPFSKIPAAMITATESRAHECCVNISPLFAAAAGRAGEPDGYPRIAKCCRNVRRPEDAHLNSVEKLLRRDINCHIK